MASGFEDEHVYPNVLALETLVLPVAFLEAALGEHFG